MALKDLIALTRNNIETLKTNSDTQGDKWLLPESQMNGFKNCYE
jgi:hypothetical protein